MFQGIVFPLIYPSTTMTSSWGS